MTSIDIQETCTALEFIEVSATDAHAICVLFLLITLLRFDNGTKLIFFSKLQIFFIVSFTLSSNKIHKHLNNNNLTKVLFFSQQIKKRAFSSSLLI